EMKSTNKGNATSLEIPMKKPAAVDAAGFFVWWSIGDSTPASTRTFASTLMAVSVSLGSFSSTFWIPLVVRLASVFPFLHSEPEKVYFVSILIYIVMATVFFIFDPRPKKR
ncbi:MAG: hypothetical protein IJK59_04590, partial [Firmicutes bacterium]|nr:hypothetical protein [Bacillota bacterium]